MLKQWVLIKYSKNYKNYKQTLMICRNENDIVFQFTYTLLFLSSYVLISSLFGSTLAVYYFNTLTILFG